MKKLSFFHTPIYITAEITCVTGAKKTAKEQSKIPW